MTSDRFPNIYEPRMTAEYYKYIGDEIGTELERKTYRVVRRGIDNVVLEDRSRERVEVSREEWDHHHDTGLLKERRQF